MSTNTDLDKKIMNTGIHFFILYLYLNCLNSYVNIYECNFHLHST